MTHVLSLLNGGERKFLSNDLNNLKLKNVPFNPQLRDYIINNFSLPSDRNKNKTVITGAFVSDVRNMYKQKFLVKRKELNEVNTLTDLIQTFDYVQFSDDETLYYMPQEINRKDFSMFVEFVKFIGQMKNSLNVMKTLYNSRNTKNESKYNKHILALNAAAGDLPDGKLEITLPIADFTHGRFDKKGVFFFYNPKDVMKYTPPVKETTDLVEYSILWMSGVNGKASNVPMRAIAPKGILNGVYDFSDDAQKDTRDKKKMVDFMKNFSINGSISEMIYGNVEPTKLSVQFIQSLDGITLSNYSTFQKYNDASIQDNRLIVMGKKGSGKGVLATEIQKHFEGKVYVIDSDEYGMSIQNFLDRNYDSSTPVDELKKEYIQLCKDKSYENSESYFENEMLNIVSDPHNYNEKQILKSFSDLYAKCMMSKIYSFRTFANARIESVISYNPEAKFIFFVHTYGEAAEICNPSQIINLKPNIDTSRAMFNRNTHDKENIRKDINYKVQLFLSNFYDKRISSASVNKSILGVLRLYGITPEFNLVPIKYSDTFNYTDDEFTQFFELKKDSVYPKYKIQGKTLTKYMNDIKNIHGNIITAMLKKDKIHLSYRDLVMSKLSDFKSLLETGEGRNEFSDYESGIRLSETIHKYHAFGYTTDPSGNDLLSNGIYILLNLVKHFKGDELNKVMMSRDTIIEKVRASKWLFPNLNMNGVDDVVINFFI